MWFHLLGADVIASIFSIKTIHDLNEHIRVKYKAVIISNKYGSLNHTNTLYIFIKDL